jgi:putative copper export protein
MRMERSRERRILGILLVILGVAALAIGVVYFQVTADKLPSLMGRLAGHPIHRTKRGTVSLIVGAVLILAGFYTLNRSRFSRFR